MPAAEPPKTFCPNCRRFLIPSEIFWSCWQPLTEDQLRSRKTDDEDSKAWDMTSQEGDDDDGFQWELKCCYTLNNNQAKECSSCGKNRATEESRNACQYCGSELPAFLEGLDPSTITVTGPSGAGKSHYIVALHEWWSTYLGDIGLSHFSAMGHRTEAAFEKMRSMVVDHKKVLPATVKNRMISFSWQILPPAAFNKPGILITLPDVSGERLYDVRALNENRHYRHAGGIIFLLDADRFGYGASSGTRVRPAADHMRVANAMIQDMRSRLSQQEWTDIPIAVCVNKVDTLLGDPHWDNIINRIIPQHEGGFDLAACNARSHAIRETLWQSPASRPIVNLMDNNFVQVKYFGVATLGGMADSGKDVDLSPISVEDPFLWLLYARGYISAKP
ncbi:MAG: hypothetical protein JNG86_17930 [Verrucomicrobiaceae bacterium]|nr:hypothetical protein [Verrucomicrobiaceae bacterium]